MIKMLNSIFGQTTIYKIYIVSREPILRWPTSATAIKKSSRQKRKAHGKREKLTAKEKSSQQKRRAHSKKEKLTAKEKSSRQKRKAYGKKEKFTAKEKVSLQKRKAHDKKEKLTSKAHSKKEKLAAEVKISRRKLKSRSGSKNSWRCLWLSLVFGELHAVYNQLIQRDIHYCSLSV